MNKTKRRKEAHNQRVMAKWLYLVQNQHMYSARARIMPRLKK